MNQIVTTWHGNSTPTLKPFSFSYSRIKNFESCPLRHHEIDILKRVKEEEGEALLWGNHVHKAAAARLGPSKTPLPPGMESTEKWCARLDDGVGQLLTEQQLAITKEFAPCAWFSKEAWFRSIADVLKINDTVAMAADWKTGKVVEDGVQLALMAAVIFIHHPAIQNIRTEFIWLAHDASTRVDFAREDMPKIWRDVWPRIEALEQAHVTQNYPPKPGGLCKRWCPVSSCKHHGT